MLLTEKKLNYTNISTICNVAVTKVIREGFPIVYVNDRKTFLF